MIPSEVLELGALIENMTLDAFCALPEDDERSRRGIAAGFRIYNANWRHYED